MKIVLLNQSSTGLPQIPSAAAGLSSAASDLAALDALGVEHGVNAGLADSGVVDATKTLTQKTKENFDSQLANMPSFVNATWFSHNIETLPVTQAIRHGPSSQPMDNDGTYITIPYCETQAPTNPVKSAMRELASRSDYTYDESSPTLLLGGAIPTHTEFYDAMVACMVETMQYLRSQFAGSTLYDWRSGAKPLPWLSSGWWLNPDYLNPQYAYSRANRTANGTQTYQLGGATGFELTLSTGGESQPYDAAYWDAGLLTQTRKTAEHSKPFFTQSPADIICYTAYVNPSTEDIATVNPAVSTAGYYPVGLGNGQAVRYVPRQDAIDSIYKAIRWSWLEHYRAFGHRIGCYTQPAIDFWTVYEPHWGLACSPQEWESVKLNAMFDPVTATEALRHGLPEGLVVGGSVVYWNNTDFYMRRLFGASPHASVHQGQYNGEWIARRNIERRFAGRHNTTIDWTSTNWATNEWYKTLAALFTEDIIERVEVTRKVLDRTAQRGAAKQSTLLGLV